MALDKGAQGVVISEAGFAYGGMAASSVCARKTEAFLVSKRGGTEYRACCSEVY